MSDKPISTNERIDQVAKDFLNTARKSGNSTITFDDARRRVADARRKGDAKRANGNR